MKTRGNIAGAVDERADVAILLVEEEMTKTYAEIMASLSDDAKTALLGEHDGWQRPAHMVAREAGAVAIGRVCAELVEAGCMTLGDRPRIGGVGMFITPDGCAVAERLATSR